MLFVYKLFPTFRCVIFMLLTKALFFGMMYFSDSYPRGTS